MEQEARESIKLQKHNYKGIKYQSQEKNNNTVHKNRCADQTRSTADILKREAHAGNSQRAEVLSMLLTKVTHIGDQGETNFEIWTYIDFHQQTHTHTHTAQQCVGRISASIMRDRATSRLSLGRRSRMRMTGGILGPGTCEAMMACGGAVECEGPIRDGVMYIVVGGKVM